MQPYRVSVQSIPMMRSTYHGAEVGVCTQCRLLFRDTAGAGRVLDATSLTSAGLVEPVLLREQALSEPESLREDFHEHEIDLSGVLDEWPDRPCHARVYGRGICAVDGLRERERVILRDVD